jgi:hypothetical protein
MRWPDDNQDNTERDAITSPCGGSPGSDPATTCEPWADPTVPSAEHEAHHTEHNETVPKNPVTAPEEHAIIAQGNSPDHRAHHHKAHTDYGILSHGSDLHCPIKAPDQRCWRTARGRSYLTT